MGWEACAAGKAGWRAQTAAWDAVLASDDAAVPADDRSPEVRAASVRHSPSSAMLAALYRHRRRRGLVSCTRDERISYGILVIFPLARVQSFCILVMAY